MTAAMLDPTYIQAPDCGLNVPTNTKSSVAYIAYSLLHLRATQGWKGVTDLSFCRAGFDCAADSTASTLVLSGLTDGVMLGEQSASEVMFPSMSILAAPSETVSALDSAPTFCESYACRALTADCFCLLLLRCVENVARIKNKKKAAFRRSIPKQGSFGDTGGLSNPSLERCPFGVCCAILWLGAAPASDRR